MIKICHLYPDLLNLYGDRGNVIAFQQRCRWRNIPVEVHEVSIGEALYFEQYDFVFLGGGSDREQNLIAADLMRWREELKDAVEKGLVLLAICGGYQLLGKYYLTRAGENMPGLDILDFHTRAGDRRLVGNVAIETSLGGEPVRLTGFENHSGQTYLGNIRPLGKVLSGKGNNGKDGREGVLYKNVFGSYLHGPLLPKNARLTDHLISLVLKRKGRQDTLKPLDNTFEDRACAVMLRRMGLL
jgi:hypothetical protein